MVQDKENEVDIKYILNNITMFLIYSKIFKIFTINYLRSRITFHIPFNSHGHIRTEL